MPRKKQINNIQPQDLQPIEEPMEESMEVAAPPRKSTERIMPQMSLKPENPRKTHVAGFVMLFLATAAAGAAVYYWPGYGLRDFMASNNSTTSTYTPVNHKPSDAGTNTTPSATTTTGKTYASSTYNFEVTYPTTATLTGDFDKDKSIAIHEGTAAQADLQLEFVAKPIADVRGEIASTFKVVSAKDTKFAGLAAREIIVGVEDIGPARILLISRPGGTFKIINPVGSYDQILASFKFTK
jgi:hypothetical protein